MINLQKYLYKEQYVLDATFGKDLQWLWKSFWFGKISVGTNQWVSINKIQQSQGKLNQGKSSSIDCIQHKGVIIRST